MVRLDDRPEIAILGRQPRTVMQALEGHFRLHPVVEAPDPLAALRDIGPRIRGAVSHGMGGISRAQIDAMPNLEICSLLGVGLETSDVELCRTRGIVLTTASVLYDDVADMAIALALAACRRLVQADRYIRAGRWGKDAMVPGRKLTGMRVGILGLGRIGREIAARLEGFKVEIGYVDPVARPSRYKAFPDALSLARASDLLFLCASGGPRGAGAPIVGKDVIEALGPRGIFVNVARGWHVDEAALTTALVDGRLGAAGLDVFDDEPHVPEPLRTLDTVVLTPHVATSTEETMAAMGDCVVGNLVSWFAGRGALTPVT